MASNDVHSDSWACAGASRGREIEAEAVVSQRDVIVQKAESIVLVYSTRERVMSYLP